MSVNLNKQSHKVSLQKDELKKETVNSKNLTNDAGSAGKERKKLRLLWIVLLIVAVAAVVLFASRSVGSDSAKNTDEISALAINEETEIKIETDEEETNEDETYEDETHEDKTGEEDDLNKAAQAEESDDLQNSTEDSMSIVDSGQRADDVSIHHYEVIVADVTWSEAFSDCIARGGYLCRINSVEENERIKELLIDQNIRGVVYLGGMRAEASNEYYWVDENMNPYDGAINGGEYTQFWYDGEPSYADYIDGEKITETYMAFIYRSLTKEWVWNDVSDDVLSLAPDFYSGKLSYICEYE